MPNFLINALGLPHNGHLLYALTPNLGCRIAFILRAFFANFSSLLLYDLAKKCIIINILYKKACLLHLVCYTNGRLISERHTQKFKKFFPFVITICSIHDSNIKPIYFIYSIIINFGKNYLFFYSQ